MIIYVEGPAGAGKTSFVKRLAKEYGSSFIVIDEYMGEEDESTRKGLDTFMAHTDQKIQHLQSLGDQDRHILVDRGYYSMIVNAIVEEKLGIRAQVHEIEKWLEKNQANLVHPDLIVFIHAPATLIHERAKENGWHREDLGWTADPEMAVSVYHEVFEVHASGIPILQLDGSLDTDKLVDEFLDSDGISIS